MRFSNLTGLIEVNSEELIRGVALAMNKVVNFVIPFDYENCPEIFFMNVSMLENFFLNAHVLFHKSRLEYNLNILLEHRETKVIRKGDNMKFELYQRHTIVQNSLYTEEDLILEATCGDEDYKIKMIIRNPVFHLSTKDYFIDRIIHCRSLPPSMEIIEQRSLKNIDNRQIERYANFHKLCSKEFVTKLSMEDSVKFPVMMFAS